MISLTIRSSGAAFLLLAILLSQIAKAQAAEFTLGEAKEIAATPLTSDGIKKVYRIEAAIARTGADEVKQTDRTLDEQIRALTLMPNVEKLCRGEGLSVRDYALLTLAINFALLPTNGSAYRTQFGRKLDDPLDVAAPPEHVQFVMDHLAEIENGKRQVLAVYEATRKGRK